MPRGYYWLIGSRLLIVLDLLFNVYRCIVVSFVIYFTFKASSFSFIKFQFDMILSAFFSHLTFLFLSYPSSKQKGITFFSLDILLVRQCLVIFFITSIIYHIFPRFSTIIDLMYNSSPTYYIEEGVFLSVLIKIILEIIRFTISI